MNIAQLVSNYHTASADSTQAIYSHTAVLADRLVDLKHKVTLFGAGNSVTKAALASVTEQSLKELQIPEPLTRSYIHALISDCYSRAAEFDVIHSHFTLLSAFYARLVATPTIHSIHSPIEEATKPILLRYKDQRFVSFTHAQREQMPELNWVATIYHGVDTETFSFDPEPDDYFLYLGRITADKGAHLAIEAAVAAGANLVIAGGSYPAEGYWQKYIEPAIDGRQIRYIGQADFATKISYLQKAKALLFPTQVAETFGLSMIEAMSCGTPVIGWNSGSIPEVVQDRQTGYVVKTVSGMVRAMQAVDKISRVATRERVERLFSIGKMVAGYEKVYARVAEAALKKSRKNKAV